MKNCFGICSLFLFLFVTSALLDDSFGQIQHDKRSFFANGAKFPKIAYEANDMTKVVVDWSTVKVTTSSIPTLQVVVNPLIRRGSAIHDGTFKALVMLQATNVRFVPWLPYPRLAVAELEPPAGNPHCGQVLSQTNLLIECKNGGLIQRVNFGAFGDVSGRCTSFQANPQCSNTADVASYLEKNCVNKSSCLVAANKGNFPLPSCGSSNPLTLAVQWECDNAVNKTSWDFSLLDPMMEDLLKAVTVPGTNDTKGAIINFSTPPQWLWATSSDVSYPDDPNQVFLVL
jgi:hypothetical protein